MTALDQDLDALFKRLHLDNARRVWRDLVQRAERGAWSYGDFFTLLVGRFRWRQFRAHSIDILCGHG
jgi:hypothetical protein